MPVFQALKWTFVIIFGAGLLLAGVWWSKQPKFIATARFSLNEAVFAKVFDPAALPSPNPYFIQTPIEQIKSQRIIFAALSTFGIAPSPDSYRAAMSQMTFRKSEAKAAEPAAWSAAYRDDNPEKCVRFLNAVLTKYDTLLAERLARKDYQGTPIFALTQPARNADRRFPAGLLLAGSGTVVIALALVAMGRQKLEKVNVSQHAFRSVGVSPAGLGSAPAAASLHQEESGHRSWFIKAVLLCALFPAIGCTTPSQFRARMEKAARPDEGIQQTQFAHIGEIVTKMGTYHVAVQRRILTGMMAPRGIASRLLIFDQQANIVAAYEPVMATSAEPLWCEGPRVYLHGYGSFLVAGTFRPVRMDPRISANRGNFRFGSPYPDSQTGNVLDFNRGPADPVLTREKRYGSSGGIADDPWELAGQDSTPES